LEVASNSGAIGEAAGGGNDYAGQFQREGVREGVREAMGKQNRQLQAEYKARRYAAGYRQKVIWVKDGAATPAPSEAGAAAKQADPKHGAWEAELKAEQLKAARQAGRDGERQKHYERGYVTGIIQAARKLAERSPAAAQVVLAYLQITRDRAIKAGLDNFSLSSLDKAGAWEPPPPELQ
jgi:hypothetical protein